MKIIVTKKRKNHMEIHRNDFLVDYNKLIREFEVSEEASKLDKEFISIQYDFKRIVGISGVIDVNKYDDVVYAKRIGRKIYSKFVRNITEGIETSKVIFILRKNIDREYFLITMFPGEMSEREPEDKNINTFEELMQSLNFWKNKAFIWKEKIIDLDTITYECPYKSLKRKVKISNFNISQPLKI
ncbi:MAG: hypothetical protein SPE00_05840 [Bacilli bacterium]|nr:hypothetical protein [Bacilli bacterium]